MRSRVLSLIVLGLLILSLAAPAAQSRELLLAQEEEVEGQEGTDEETAEESGADEGETVPAVEETGPPWTYQMARMGIALLVLMAFGVAFAYYRFVVKRQRGVV
jgi:hypothetical protein